MFTLKIKTDNEAFSEDPGYEVASILKKIIQKLERGETEGVAMDTNGNKVGRWELEESISAIERGFDMSKATEFVNELNTFQQGIVDLEREHGGDLLKNRDNSRDPGDHPKYLVANYDAYEKIINYGKGDIYNLVSHSQDVKAGTPKVVYGATPQMDKVLAYYAQKYPKIVQRAKDA